MQLAGQHHHAGRLAEAEKIYRRVLAENPRHANALYLLGAIASQKGTIDQAIDLIGQAININPSVPDFYNSLGVVLGKRGLHAQAIGAFRNAIALKSDFADAYSNLGNSLSKSLQWDEAIAALRKSAQLDPKSAQAQNNLGAALYFAGRVEEAILCYRMAIQLQPSFTLAHNNLSAALRDAGQIDEAILSARSAISLDRGFLKAYVNLGAALKDAGQIDEAIAVCRTATTLAPDFYAAGSNLLYFSYFHPDFSPQMILTEHQKWAQRFADPLMPSKPRHTNDPSPERRLKIGYVSADFRLHPVGRFLLPLLAHHDHRQFEIHCYDHGRRADSITARLRSFADQWHDTALLSDEALADQIRGDEIDILVDLTLHMAGCRLLAFARKPAPVQVTWLGYVGTTGLSAIDYRISDPYLDPPETSDGDYVEKTLRIPCYWCYEPLDSSPGVNSPAAQTSGHITFGCLNHFSKVNAVTLQLWAGLMQRVENSHLLLYSVAGSQRQRTLKIFTDAGIHPSKIIFVTAQEPEDYLKQYHLIDIALDTMPYGGGTTTCDALWMGVPVVTLRGQTGVGRGGVSLLSQIALTGLIAETPQEYVLIASGLATDLPKLAALRATLRSRMQNSLLMDAPRFAASMETAYRGMWRESKYEK
jgi:protein O-GlcNAc transferase